MQIQKDNSTVGCMCYAFEFNVMFAMRCSWASLKAETLVPPLWGLGVHAAGPCITHWTLASHTMTHDLDP